MHETAATGKSFPGESLLDEMENRSEVFVSKEADVSGRPFDRSATIAAATSDLLDRGPRRIENPWPGTKCECASKVAAILQPTIRLSINELASNSTF